MGKILYANDLWFQGGSLLFNNGVCLSDMFIKLVNDILDRNGENISVWLWKTFTESYW